MKSRVHCYKGEEGCVKWRGIRFTDAGEFVEYLQSKVRERVDAADFEAEFQEELQIALSGMDEARIVAYLETYDNPTDDLSWKIGEALAECLLADVAGAVFPWNRDRDEPLPRLSLPGNDVIGFIKVDGEWWFLYGETKTSADTTNLPPTVMRDMQKQLVRHLDRGKRRGIHAKAMRYLHARTKESPYREAFRQAVERHCKSDNSFVLVGILLRDTDPTEDDVKSESKKLAEVAEEPTRVRVDAHYLPVPISDWPTHLRGEAA